MIRLKTILKSNLFLIIFLCLSSLSIMSIKRKSIYSENAHNFNCIVWNISSSKTLLKCDELIEIDNINDLEIGDIIEVNGTLEEFNSNTNFNMFNYKEYQNNRGIFYKLKINDYKKIKTSNNLVLKIKKAIKDRIRDTKSNKYLEAFLLGDKSYLDNDIKDLYTKLGIIHIFAISGMHIGIIVELINKVSKRNNYKRKLITYSLILFYYLLIDSISLLRSLIFLMVKDINNIFKLDLSKYKIIIISILIILTLRGYAYKEIGFYYSTIISSGIYLSNKRINKINNKLLKTLYIYLIAYLLSLPLNIYLYYELNILSILNNIILVPIISSIIFPLSLITSIFPFIDNLLFILIRLFELISYLLSTLSIEIILMKPSISVVIIYYIVIISILINRKFIYLLIAIIFIHKNINILKPSTYVMFYDVGQGDSILIHKNNKNILIDTGGKANSSYSIVLNTTIKSLKSQGIDKLDALITTHGDYDHMGEGINLVNNFKVEKVIFNCGPYNDLEKELIEVLDKKKIKYYSCIKELKINENKLYFLQTKEYDNENDNSNVIYTELNGYNFMFMGDASITTEKEILEKYNLSDIDVLKVGHHGSKTSSSKEFINEINPTYSVISVGKNNKYGHPNKEVLSNLNNSIIYRTDQDGSVLFKIKNNKLEIETCSL